MKASFANPESLLPHRFPALLVTEILEYSEDAVRCSGRVPEEHPAVRDGVVPSVLAVEFAAQGAGLVLALRKMAAKSPPVPGSVGYLVTLKAVHLEPQPVPADVELVASVRMEVNFGTVASFAFLIELSGATIARGRLGVATPLR